MSHLAQMNFGSSIKDLFPKNFKECKVLEIGSYNVNGTVRDFFSNCIYYGIDVFEGDGVDIICSGHQYEGDSKSFDTILSCECFEHNLYWLETFKNMIRMLKSGGLLIFTCATTGRAEHGTRRTSPSESLTTNIAELGDYYRNLTEVDFVNSSADFSLFSRYEFSVNEYTNDLYFFGVVK